MSYEKLIIEGNLGRDPDLRHTQDGTTAVTTISVAVNKKRNGEKATSWYSVSVWGGQAESVCEYLKKGSKVLVEGTNLRVNQYTGKDGKSVATIELTAERVVFLDSAEDSNGNGNGGNADGKPEADIPF